MAFMNKSLSGINSSTSIPNQFIDNYMADASPLFVMVYIFGVRHFLYNNNEMTTEDISENLGIFQSEVKKAWEYWEEKGLVKIHKSDDDLLIEFISFDEKEATPNTKTIERKDITNINDTKINISVQPAYTPQEIDIYVERSSEIKLFFKKAEEIFSKPLTYSELNLFLTFFEWYGLPLDVIVVMLDYCVSRDKKNPKYLETVARDWSENNIDNIEKANIYIESFSGYDKIMRAFGIIGKSPNKKQLKYIKRWLEEYGLPIEIIVEACEESFLRTGTSEFKYADTTITNWHQNNVKTLDDIERVKKEHKENNTKAEKIDKSKNFKNQIKPSAYKNRFINYKQREWDYDLKLYFRIGTDYHTLFQNY